MIRRRTLLAHAAAGLGLLTACGEGSTTTPPGVPPGGPPGAGEDTPEASDWTAGTTAKGTYLVRWRPESGILPRNEYFSLEIEVRRAGPGGGAAIEGAQVYVRADMPAHGHGMNVVPAVLEVGGGRYRAEGMLLHMRGDWKLGVDVIVGGTAESANFDLSLG